MGDTISKFGRRLEGLWSDEKGGRGLKLLAHPTLAASTLCLERYDIHPGISGGPAQGV